MGLVKDFPNLCRSIDAEGQEHDVWVDVAHPDGPLVWKANKPGAYGLVAGEHRLSHPLDYLDRIHLTNLILGFPWELQGVWMDVYGRPRLVSTQWFMAGRPADDAEIQACLRALGFAPGDDGLWFHRDVEVVVSDAYPDNFVVLDDGYIAPVDLAIARSRRALA